MLAMLLPVALPVSVTPRPLPLIAPRLEMMMFPALETMLD